MMSLYREIEWRRSSGVGGNGEWGVGMMGMMMMVVMGGWDRIG
jgi:hypothetical protein